jgi:hypothetical protein
MYHLSGGNNKIELITNVFLYTDTDLHEANNWKEKIISILKKVPSKADVLKPAIEFLVVILKPSKIYMLRVPPSSLTTRISISSNFALSGSVAFLSFPAVR